VGGCTNICGLAGIPPARDINFRVVNFHKVHIWRKTVDRRKDEYGKMDAQEVQEYFMTFASAVSRQFEKIPGSAILARYIKSSYQNDPIRSAVELFLVLFAVRYLLAPKYSTKPNYVKLSEEVILCIRPRRGGRGFLRANEVAGF
jgi:hypothetical protein